MISKKQLQLAFCSGILMTIASCKTASVTAQTTNVTVTAEEQMYRPNLSIKLTPTKVKTRFVIPIPILLNNAVF